MRLSDSGVDTLEHCHCLGGSVQDNLASVFSGLNVGDTGRSKAESRDILSFTSLAVIYPSTMSFRNAIQVSSPIYICSVCEISKLEMDIIYILPWDEVPPPTL